jgi:hypothetical protein
LVEENLLNCGTKSTCPRAFGWKGVRNSMCSLPAAKPF